MGNNSKHDAQTLSADICIIGGGSAGLSLAAGAVQMGASVILLEKGKMGGECLNSGCVPSKALLAAAKKGFIAKELDQFGWEKINPKVNFKAVHKYVQDVIARISPHDSVNRFQDLGVKIIQSSGKFVDPKTIIVEDQNLHIKAKRYVIATGSSPAIPPIEGIKSVPYLTNETIFALKALPAHLIILGGGPIGIEMAQAFCRLGSQVTVLEGGSILNKDDPEMVSVLRESLAKEGIKLHEGVKITRVEKSKADILVHLENAGKIQKIKGTHLLIAAGRRPNIEGLDLEAAGVIFNPKGIEVDARLRTSNKHIFAMGDVIGKYQFTHMAGYHAGIVLRNILFKLPAKANATVIPWVTYTDPELAHVGLTEAMAQAQNLKHTVLKEDFLDNDRAQTESSTVGGIKVIVGPKDAILGVTILGAHAGELILPWVLAMNEALTIKAMTSCIVPYPTLSEISKRAAGDFYKPALFNERVRKIVRFLLRWI